MRRKGKLDILKDFKQENLFALAGFPVVEHKVTNPFREDDNFPGCFYDWFEYDNGLKVLYFYDFTGYFGKNGVSSVEVLQEFTGIEDWHRLYYWVKHKMGHTDFESIELPEVPTFEVKIEVEDRPWTKYNYFSQFEIPTVALSIENVLWAKSYRCSTRRNESMIENLLGDPTHTPIVAYKFENRYKLYNPYASKSGGIKWYGNINMDDIWGFDTFNDSSDYCIVTKSAKDFLVIKYVLGYECMAVQSENVKELKKLAERLEGKRVFIIFDSDEVGKRQSEALAEETGWTAIHLPEIKNAKDTAEIIYEKGSEAAKNIFKEFKICVKHDYNKKRIKNLF